MSGESHTFDSVKVRPVCLSVIFIKFIFIILVRGVCKLKLLCKLIAPYYCTAYIQYLPYHTRYPTVISASSQRQRKDKLLSSCEILTVAEGTHRSE
jgi:hypothetical protein